MPCGWAAWRGRWDDARGALITLAAAGGGASIAFVRSFADVRHAGAALDGPRVPVPDDADAQTRHVAFMGRHP